MELFNEDKIPKRTLGEVVILDNTITSPSIVNGSFLGGSITIGSGENVFRVDRNGIYLGSSSFATAPFRVDMQGNLVASSARIAGDIVSDNYVEGVSGYKLEYETGNAYLGNAIISGSSIIGDNNVLARTIGSSINQSGQFIKDVVNTNLSTATKQILGDFTFGSYGAIKMITDDNNGVWLSPTGILGKKAGATTFTIGADGNATFSGNVTGATITGSTITGGTIQTASGTAERMVILGTDNNLTFYNADNAVVTQLGGGESIASALRITLDTDITTGVKVNGTHDNNIGYRFDYSGSYTTNGLYVGLTGATNDGNCINLIHNGSSGYGVYINTTAGARGLGIFNSGNANSIYINHSHDSAKGIDVAYSGRQEALYISGNDANSSKPLIYATSNQTDGTSCAVFNKSDYGSVVTITSVNSSNNNYSTGIKMNIASSGTSVETAFEFAGSEYISNATGVSGVTGVIKILTSDGLCYIPVYSSYS